MVRNTIAYFFILLIICFGNSAPQSGRLTKGAENGYAWINMEDPARLFSTSKETYLSSILDRFRLTGAKYPDVESLGCNEEINRLYIDGKSEEVSLEDIVREIDGFYSRSDNMIIPIIFAYCYTIKKIAGASADELNEYKKKLFYFVVIEITDQASFE